MIFIQYMNFKVSLFAYLKNWNMFWLMAVVTFVHLSFIEKNIFIVFLHFHCFSSLLFWSWRVRLALCSAITAVFAGLGAAMGLTWVPLCKSSALSLSSFSWPYCHLYFLVQFAGSLSRIALRQLLTHWPLHFNWLISLEKCFRIPFISRAYKQVA